jgi:hypothetical protein
VRWSRRQIGGFAEPVGGDPEALRGCSFQEVIGLCRFRAITRSWTSCWPIRGGIVYALMICDIHDVPISRTRLP